MQLIALMGVLISIGAIGLGHLHEGGTLSSLFQPSAVLIVFGGTLGAILMQSSPATFLRAVQAGVASFTQEPVDFEACAERLAAYSRKAVRESLLALDKALPDIDEPFMRRALTLVVDRYPVHLLRDTLTLEAQIQLNRSKAAARTWESAAGYAPTIGILGSVLGLLHIMDSLDDPAKLGAGIAVSFVATLYGLALANLVCLPIATRLKSLTADQATYLEMVIETAVLTAQNENARHTAERPNAFIPAAAHPTLSQEPSYEPAIAER